jgi:hypothetical protein
MVSKCGLRGRRHGPIATKAFPKEGHRRAFFRHEPGRLTREHSLAGGGRGLARHSPTALAARSPPWRLDVDDRERTATGGRSRRLRRASPAPAFDRRDLIEVEGGVCAIAELVVPVPPRLIGSNPARCLEDVRRDGGHGSEDTTRTGATSSVARRMDRNDLCCAKLTSYLP